MLLWFYIGIRMFQGFLAFFFNLGVLICVIKFRFLRRASDGLVASLALSDSIHGIIIFVVLPLREYLTPSFWPVYKYLCYVIIGGEAMLVYIQLTMFTLLSIERFKSLRSQLGMGSALKAVHVGILIALTWVLMGAWLVAMGLSSSPPAEGSTCSPWSYFSPFSIKGNLAILIINTLITLFHYIRIGKLALQRSNRVSDTLLTTNQIRRRKAESRITKMIGMVVGIFFFTYIPFFVMAPFIKVSSPTPIKILYYSTVILYDVNFWINPVIFAWRDKAFRKAFKAAFKFLACQPRDAAGPTPTPGGSGSADGETLPVPKSTTVYNVSHM